MAKIRGIKPETFTDSKILSLSPVARWLFIGLWTEACDNGHVNANEIELKVRLLPVDNEDIGALISEIEATGMIERDLEGLTVLNLPKHQKIDRRYFKKCDRPDCLTPIEREQIGIPHPSPDGDPAGTRRDHGGATREHASDTTGPHDDGDGDGDGDGELMVMVTKSDSEESHNDKITPEIQALCEHLADWIERNGSKRPNITPTWLIECERLNRIDGYTHEQIRFIIDWSQRNTFWRSNILSMPTLRKKFDQLRLRSVEEHEKNRQQGQPPLSRSDQLYIAEMQRLHAEEQAQPGQLTIEGSSL